MTPTAETKNFYACPYRRCPVRYWPVEVGDRCPKCGMAGVYAGMVTRVSTPPQADPTD